MLSGWNRELISTCISHLKIVKFLLFAARLLLMVVAAGWGGGRAEGAGGGGCGLNNGQAAAVDVDKALKRR